VAERARPDDRIARLHVHVADRGMVDRDAVRAEPERDGSCCAFRVGGIAGRTDLHRAREDRAVADADDAPAFLIDAHRYRWQAAAARGGDRFAQHRADLLARADVPAVGEQEEAADPSARDAVEQRAWDDRSVESRPDQRSTRETRAHTVETRWSSPPRRSRCARTRPGAQ